MQLAIPGCFLLNLLWFQSLLPSQADPLELLVVTVATDKTDGFKRLEGSLKLFNLKFLVLGMHEKWKGGYLRLFPGGGQKINILKRELEKYKNNKNLVLFFTDSYDVVFTAGKEEILTKFKEFNARIVFSAESTIWPDGLLENRYPEVTFGKRFLCSGGIIGYADTFWSTITKWNVEDTDSDQLYYTKIYLNATLRTQLNATLDHTSTLVQNINFAKYELEMVEEDTLTRIKNLKYSTLPSVIHGNGPSKIYLNHLTNYVPDGWHSEYGCRQCSRNLIDLPNEPKDKLPSVQLAIFIEQPTPFLEEFLQRLEQMSYPKSRITLFVHNNEGDADCYISQFMLRHRSKYAAFKIVSPHENIDEKAARNMAVNHCIEIACDYQFSVDSYVQITEPDILKFLISKNKQVIAPIVVQNGKLWSNFWGAINIDGYYARSDDYLAIVNNERSGIWNVPFVNAVYLTKGSTLKYTENKIQSLYNYEDFDADMAYCNHMRDEEIFIFATNEIDFGRLMFTENVMTGIIHPDWWQIEDNTEDWEERYIHPDFWNATLDGVDIAQPCPDVYMFPLFTHRAADTLVEIMEDYGQWSGGKNKDTRLAGGYENVPTVDINMNQIAFKKEWLFLLRHYPTKIVEKVYPGFYTEADSSMMFVVRYKPTEQSFLRPHHDSSTWTMNIALNSHGTDYEGGGCRFLRYDCSVTNIPKGYALIHPGRLTHYHEGLLTTNGTRYIAVSFVDP
ncbi:procollagen-lysine,2-oxoglutarate 5-dioxygenase 1-like isoform X1 [Clavelina lepadiformis]|uniref:procollagen-lysine,2-oxoglutarate 5-dioxygenase 1-like isoform X1 n=2 Tax=Clavelina lepadiformis TaxID=159417 RepID=UPI0040428E75